MMASTSRLSLNNNHAFSLLRHLPKAAVCRQLTVRLLHVAAISAVFLPSEQPNSFFFSVGINGCFRPSFPPRSLHRRLLRPYFHDQFFRPDNAILLR